MPRSSWYNDVPPTSAVPMSRREPRNHARPLLTGTLAAACFLSACNDGGPVRTNEELALTCSIPTASILAGARKDGIPALTDPQLLMPNGAGPAYPDLDERIVAAFVGGEAIAVPIRLFWYHEIVNVSLGGQLVAITHCPLTGSTLAFDRGPVDGAEFGVSGLLYQNNLLMYDRSGASESLWPQMYRGARCGDRDGVQLPMIPVVEMNWGGWLGLHPETRVVSKATGFGFDYEDYPYGRYDEPDNDQLLFPLADPMDRRRPPKERVIGVPDGDGGVAFPFGELVERAGSGDLAVVHGSTSEGEFVVMWDGRRDGALVFRPEVAGQTLTFSVSGTEIIDAETGSSWTAGGQATQGPLAGEAMEPVPEAFVAYWFAWPVFYPNVELWAAP